MAYEGNFSNDKDVYRNFCVSEEDQKGIKILFAWYGYSEYDGSAFVLFDRCGKLYEVNGGHCSCYGLEGQWDPEETSVKALVHRIENGSLGTGSYYNDNEFKVTLKKILTRWARKHLELE